MAFATRASAHHDADFAHVRESGVARLTAAAMLAYYGAGGARPLTHCGGRRAAAD